MALQLQRVLISDSVDASCRRILEEGGVAVDYRPGLSKEDLLDCIKVVKYIVPTGTIVRIVSCPVLWFAMHYVYTSTGL